MFGEPRKTLSVDEVLEYKTMGCRIEYMSKEEVKQLNIK